MADFKTNRASEHRCRHLRREERRAEALERQDDRSKRSATEQLALIDKRPGQSARERARLA